MRNKCRLCDRRKVRRACPALGHSICTVCCGTKRLVEIDCPSDCTYLRSSLLHPPAAFQRQREQDLHFLFPLLQDLTERQHVVTLLVQGFLRLERPASPTLVDDDIAEALRALAETYETASRGIIYEHAAGLPAAERLGAEIKQIIETRRTKGLTVSDGDVAAGLRRIETGARTAQSVLIGGNTAYRQLLQRVLKDQPPELAASGSGRSHIAGDGPSLIMPGR